MVYYVTEKCSRLNLCFIIIYAFIFFIYLFIYLFIYIIIIIIIIIICPKVAKAIEFSSCDSYHCRLCIHIIQNKICSDSSVRRFNDLNRDARARV